MQNVDVVLFAHVVDDATDEKYLIPTEYQKRSPRRDIHFGVLVEETVLALHGTPPFEVVVLTTKCA